MAKLLMKLQTTAKRDYLNTASGYSINKTEYVEVEDTDKEIESILMNRHDILVKEPSKVIKDKPSNPSQENFKEVIPDQEKVVKQHNPSKKVKSKKEDDDNE